MDDREVGARLRRIRELAGLTQQQIAAYLGISDQGYRNYEAGRTFPPYRVIHQLAELFEMPRLTLARALGLVESEEAETLEQWVTKRGIFTATPVQQNPAKPFGRTLRHKRVPQAAAEDDNPISRCSTDARMGFSLLVSRTPVLVQTASLS